MNLSNLNKVIIMGYSPNIDEISNVENEFGLKLQNIKIQHITHLIDEYKEKVEISDQMLVNEVVSRALKSHRYSDSFIKYLDTTRILLPEYVKIILNNIAFGYKKILCAKLATNKYISYDDYEWPETFPKGRKIRTT